MAFDAKLQQKILRLLPRTKLQDPGELELRFVSGSGDLNGLAKATRLDADLENVTAAKNVLRFVGKFSNFPNMLKKRSELASLFTPGVAAHAEAALVATPYLGIDTGARYYFLPTEFRLY